jgi:hypothetical protein
MEPLSDEVILHVSPYLGSICCFYQGNGFDLGTHWVKGQDRLTFVTKAQHQDDLEVT